MGALGGRKSRGGGFTNNPELASYAGTIGGSISRRGKKLTLGEQRDIRRRLRAQRQERSDMQVSKLSARFGKRRPW